MNKTQGFQLEDFRKIKQRQIQFGYNSRRHSYHTWGDYIGAFCNLQKKNETKQNENPKFPKLKFAIYETEIFYFAKRESLRLFQSF